MRYFSNIKKIINIFIVLSTFFYIQNANAADACDDLVGATSAVTSFMTNAAGVLFGTGVASELQGGIQYIETMAGGGAFGQTASFNYGGFGQYTTSFASGPPTGLSALNQACKTTENQIINAINQDLIFPIANAATTFYKDDLLAVANDLEQAGNAIKQYGSQIGNAIADIFKQQCSSNESYGALVNSSKQAANNFALFSYDQIQVVTRLVNNLTVNAPIDSQTISDLQMIGKAAGVPPDGHYGIVVQAGAAISAVNAGYSIGMSIDNESIITFFSSEGGLSLGSADFAVSPAISFGLFTGPGPNSSESAVTYGLQGEFGSVAAGLGWEIPLSKFSYSDPVSSAVTLAGIICKAPEVLVTVSFPPSESSIANGSLGFGSMTLINTIPLNSIR